MSNPSLQTRSLFPAKGKGPKRAWVDQEVVDRYAVPPPINTSKAVAERYAISPTTTTSRATATSMVVRFEKCFSFDAAKLVFQDRFNGCTVLAYKR
jgi:hypothetical protein